MTLRRFSGLLIGLLSTAAACGGSDSSSPASPSAASGAGGESAGGAAGTSGAAGSSEAGAGGTSAGGAAGTSGAAGAGGDALAATCNPLHTAGDCLLPFPSAIYESDDTTTKTGVRVALVAETLPKTTKGKHLDPTRYNAADGFSQATPILATFPEYVDPSSLNPPDHIDQSLSPTSATILVDTTTNALVAHFSEVDALAREGNGDRQTVLIHPVVRLAPGRRYAVAITDSIRTAAGGMPTPPPAFAAIADGNAPSDDLSQKQAARMPAILSALDAAGVKREHVVLAWDFVTGSDEAITSHVLSMRDRALAMVGDSGIAMTIKTIDDNGGDPDTLRRIEGTFTVPRFLTQTDLTVPDASLVFDADGKPMLMGTYEAPFIVLIPKAAATATAPLPVILYGHGLFGSGIDEISGPYVPSFANKEGYIVFGTDWTGLSKWESPLTAGGSSAAVSAISDFDDLPFITDRLQQALINAITLVRTFRGKIVDDPSLTITGQPGGAKAADASQVFYYGISLGGIMGGSFLGYDPDVLRGCLNVGGGEWSLLFQRSRDWLQLELVIGATYPDLVDQQTLLALAQMQFDYSDPISVASHVVNDPLPGVPAKQVLMQMGVGDVQVSNLATEVVARTAGVSLLAESPIDVWGMMPTPGPLKSALTIWDPKLTPLPPLTNQTPTMENGVHEAIRRIGKAEDQTAHFLQTGDIVSTCDGPCDPE